ncbi:hypothetical protein BDM02DRAFT_2301750 [Thelephora ganbajun]|uniref:Uncharacterized protein n=1 Tax=Thelephora ganbajun TaxID=370292 RepID=A0ACB6ZFL4_THEGA|nr:hypothetical protein BDM02DRAFT_2301750 [Thelephora ganbajun]
MILPGFTGSSPVSVSVEPTASWSTIALGSAYRLQLLPLFDHFGRYRCDFPLSVPTRSGFYTSEVSLECSHTPGDAGVILGPDWISACSAAPCDDWSELEGPTLSIVSSLPAGNYWTANDDGPAPSDNSIDVNIVLSKLNSCFNDPNFNVSVLFATHGVDLDDVSSNCEDVVSHFLNGQCASRKAPGCSEVARSVSSPIKMALMVTETTVVHCERKQISLADLHMCCSVIGITIRQPEYTILAQKLTARCNALRPLLSCGGLEAVFCSIETLEKQSLQHLGTQHNLNVDPEHDVNSIKMAVIDHNISNAGANSDLETYILQLAAKEAKLSKKALRRVLKSKDIEFDDGEDIGELRRHLHSYITRLRKGKHLEWSYNRRAESESKYNCRLGKIQDEWPEPAAMNLKEDCVRNFRAATSSESLCQFTCGMVCYLPFFSRTSALFSTHLSKILRFDYCSPGFCRLPAIWTCARSIQHV